MFLVKIGVKESSLHGAGCFAEENVPEGMLLWKLNPPFDIVLADVEYRNALISLPLAAQKFIHSHAYEGKGPLKGKWVVCAADAIFMNHSPNPTVRVEEDSTSYAARDIKIGEELTCNYFDYSDPVPGKLPDHYYSSNK